MMLCDVFYIAFAVTSEQQWCPWEILRHDEVYLVILSYDFDSVWSMFYYVDQNTTIIIIILEGQSLSNFMSGSHILIIHMGLA
jgi:hypothetical protein